MDRPVSENDIYRQLANYNFEKPIKITYIVEDFDLDKTNSQLPEQPVQYASPQNNNNTDSATEPLNTLARNQQCCNNVSFNENRVNSGHEPRNISNEIIEYDRNLQNPQTVNTYVVPNPNYPGEILNSTSNMSNHNHLTSDEKKIYINLLDTVSKNLINISYYYNYYNSCKHMANHSAKEKYQEYKNHYFNQSYNIVVSIFLPQERNRAFLRNFIHRTIELANRKSWYPLMNVETLEVLVYGMIDWAKKRKKYQEASENQIQQLMCAPPAASVPSAPPVPPAPTVPTSSNGYFNGNPRQPMRRPPAPVLPSEPPVPTMRNSSNCIFNGNPRQPMSRPPAPLLPSAIYARPIPIVPTSNSIYDVNTQQQMNGPPIPQVSPVPSIPAAPLVSPTAPVPPTSNSNFNARQQMSRAPPVPLLPLASTIPSVPTSNSISNANTHQLLMYRPPPVSPVRQLNRPPPVSPTQQLKKPPPVSPVQQLNGPPPVSPVLPVQNKHQNERAPGELRKNNICLFSTGPAGSEISISIDPSLAKTVCAGDARKATHNPCSKKRKTTDNTANPTILRTNSTWNAATQNHLPQNNKSPNEAPRTSNAESINTAIQPVNNSNQFLPGARQNDKELDNNECQPLLTRSVSRDSGFGSPVLCSMLTNNDYYMAYPSSTNNEEFTPEIVHVTSLNQNALYIASGACKICGSSTKNVCIVCYNEYYCGSVCQTIDWPIHKEICRVR